ncbi:MAG TPA: NUDIX hydrolase [Oscillatoriaceae cyanobacterium]
MSEHSKSLPRVRVAVVLAQEGKLLLVRHRKGEDTYWLLPGGGLDYGESLAECAARELREETGLEIAVERPIYLSEAIAPDGARHILNLYVLAHLTGGTLQAAEEAVIAEVAWVPIETLPGLRMYPAIAEELLQDLQAGFAPGMRYLGQRWT